MELWSAPVSYLGPLDGTYTTQLLALDRPPGPLVLPTESELPGLHRGLRFVFGRLATAVQLRRLGASVKGFESAVPCGSLVI